MRAAKSDPGQPSNRGTKFDLTLHEGTNFDLTHKHSGLHGDGQRIKLSDTDTTAPFPTGTEPLYIPQNAPTSGRKYRIQVIEVTDPDTQQIQVVIQVVPA